MKNYSIRLAETEPIKISFNVIKILSKKKNKLRFSENFQLNKKKTEKIKISVKKSIRIV